MSSPLKPLLFKDDSGAWRLQITGYEVTPFKATDVRHQQGRPFSKEMLSIADPSVRLSDEDALEAYESSRQYYSPTKRK